MPSRSQIASCVLLVSATEAAAGPVGDFKLVDKTFCSGDHQTPSVAAKTVADCAALVPTGGFGFEWDCDGHEPDHKSCVVFVTAADCGGLRRSGCGSQVWINRTEPLPPPAPPAPPAPPPPPVKPVYDVSAFEALVPKWIAQYKLPGSAANFSYEPGGTVPHPYAPSDVLHVLCGTGQLGTLTVEERAAHVDQIRSFQRPDGFFNESDAHGKSGGSMWHAAGYVMAGLSILDAQPLRNNALFEAIAATPSLWEPTVHGNHSSTQLSRDFQCNCAIGYQDTLRTVAAGTRRNALGFGLDLVYTCGCCWILHNHTGLLHADDVLPPYNISSGCNEGYACAQNIASLASWWIQTNESTGGLVRHSKFLSWYYSYLRAQTDPATGATRTNGLF
jgi:hypothetical protein